MKNKFHYILLISLFGLQLHAQTWIRVNQLGYLPHSVKKAVLISKDSQRITDFQVIKTLTHEVVYIGKAQSANAEDWEMNSAAKLDFSNFKMEGAYYIQSGKCTSPPFVISNHAYLGAADYILKYMRQQRCGFNPFLNDSCHTRDGFIVDHPLRNGEIIDVKGGWHDATDYLQYASTSANAVYQMLFAYLNYPDVFSDNYDKSGMPGKNAIPDILDEINWGLDWLVKMNPDSGVMFNQIADDRDHKGFRLPNKDTVSYGNGLYRPVYFVTGKPQGLSKFKNRSTGVASIAAKYCSAFALYSFICRASNPVLSKKLEKKAIEAFNFALSDLGVNQTACTISPYFYEEDNYTDDLELAAFELYRLTAKEYYLQQAKYWGALEQVTPWMELDTARHYQYYPFVNLGHANLAVLKNKETEQFIRYMRKGMQKLKERGQDDAFGVRIPFIWCSNNLVAAALSQARLYFNCTGDSSFIELESSLRDWLFGCNPWGTSMICGLPAGGDSPVFPHSSITYKLNQTTFGGLVDGPVYRSIFDNLKGITLLKQDPYQVFQNGVAVYHDDIGDYSTNEPTMDGTASLSFYFSYLENEGLTKEPRTMTNLFDEYGALIRKNQDKKLIYLVFSADEFGEGIEYILKILAKKKIKGSFFLTGNFLRNAGFKKDVEKIIAGKHFVGAHSDKHLLYMNWERRDSLIISFDGFARDIEANYAELKKFGIQPSGAGYFLAPYEWYNSTIVDWTKQLGLQLINYTPGSVTNADYTTPKMKNYKSSEKILGDLLKFETEQKDGLKGGILLIHPGTDHERTDKFYLKLENLIDVLTRKGYSFDRF